MAIQKITGIILAGGKSFRMQTDKGLMHYQGGMLIEYALNQIKELCSEVIISANKNEYESFGYPVIKDSINDIGPLGGIYSTMQKSANDLCLIIACDIVDLPTNLLTNMMKEAEDKILVSLKLTDNKLQPLPVIIHKNLIPVIENQISNNDFKLQNFIYEVERLNMNQVVCIQIKNELRNLNTLEDLKS